MDRRLHGGKFTWARRRTALIGVALVIGGLLYSFLLLLRPFSAPLIWAAVLVSVFYPLYQRLSRWLGNRSVASLLSCTLICLMIITPVLFLGVLLAKEAVEAFASFQTMLQSPEFESSLRARQLQLFSDVSSNAGRFISLDVVNLRSMLLDIVKRLSEWAVAASAALVTELTGFLIHSFIMVITMYFFFVDGEQLLGLLKRLNPVPTPYAELIHRFREVSTATFYGGVLTALTQGTLGALIFFLLDLPSPRLGGAAMAIASFIPLVGTGLVWIPMATYLCFTGQVTQGIVLFVLGAGLISTVDNLIRLLVVKERTKIHTLLVFLSVLGGLRVFGFLGLVLGPLIAAMVQTLLTSAPVERRKVAQ